MTDLPVLKVSLAELRQRRIVLRPQEAVAVVLAVGERLAWRAAPPPLTAIVLRSDGLVDVLGEPEQNVTAERYALLLDRLLPEAGAGYGPVAGGIRVLIARATGRTELPPVVGAQQFAQLLRRFGPPSVPDAIVGVMLRWADADAAPADSPQTRAYDRRVAGPTASELRSFLQEQDLERYAMRQHLARGEAPRALSAPAPAADHPLLLPSFASAEDPPAGAAAGRHGFATAVLLLAIAAGAGAAMAERGRWYDAAIAAIGSMQRAATLARAERRATAPEPATETPHPVPAATSGASDGVRTAATTHAGASDVQAEAAVVPRGLEPLRAAPAPAYSPSFGRAGALFFHASGHGGTRLLRADTDDNGNVIAQATLVDNGAQNYHVRESPDGRMVAFDSDRDGERGVYVADADGREVRRVSGPGYAALPSWSPDGRHLAFVRGEPDRSNIWNLWVLDVASGEQRQLTRYASGQVWPGGWFSDGQRLAFTHDDTLFVLDTASGGLRGYASPVAGRLVRTAAVAPDDRHIAFQVYRDGVWLLDTFTHRTRRLLADRSAEEFSWSPDGSRLAFHSQRGGRWGVWLLTAPLEDARP